jgi:peptidoglycan hydrolase-like protein with peptidoglycan-binding domain
MELGYLDSDEPSTLYNAATTVAVSLFQRTLNCEMDGIATSELQESLFSEDATPYEIKLGDSGADVESMQSRLSELGYYESKINGYFGVAPRFAGSVPNQKQVDVDGVFNVSDRDRLYRRTQTEIDDSDAFPNAKPTRATKKPSTTRPAVEQRLEHIEQFRQLSTTSSSDSSSSSTSSSTAARVLHGVLQRGRSRVLATAMLGYPYAWRRKARRRASTAPGVYSACAPAESAPSRYSAAGFPREFLDGNHSICVSKMAICCFSRTIRPSA